MTAIILSSSIFAVNVNFSDPTTTPGTTPNLSDSGQSASDAQVATDSSGRYVYAVWERDDGTNSRIQVAISSDFGVTWTDPSTTPGTTPNLSDSGKNASSAQVATDSSGRYVYAVWERDDGTNFRIQVAISSDYGVTWTDPTTTPGTTPNLSDPGQDAVSPQIATDSSGRYVYAVWRRSDGTNVRIQVAISSDFGVTWTDPTTTPGTTPNLSDSGQNAASSQIATDSSGRYVYAVWQRDDGTNLIIQVAISSDFGVTWTDPTTTPGTSPNLSDPGQDATSAQVATDSTGRYVYAVWHRNSTIQAAISSDYGVTWTDPTTTPTGTTPNLSDPGSATKAQVATDSTGRYVYAVWQRSDGTNLRIQVAISSDFGVTWIDPTITPTGTSPNLSDPGQNAQFPKIATDSSGRYVYTVWYRLDGTNNIIQAAISSDFGLSWTDPTTTPTGTSPNLSDSGQSAILPQVATDSSGGYVYAVWQRSNGTNTIIQVAIGVKSFFPIKNLTFRRV